MSHSIENTPPIHWSLKKRWINNTISLDESITLTAHGLLWATFSNRNNVIQFELQNGTIIYVEKDEYCKAIAQKIDSITPNPSNTLEKVENFVREVLPLDTVNTIQKPENLDDFSIFIFRKITNPKIPTNQVRFGMALQNKDFSISATSSDSGETTGSASDLSIAEAHNEELLLQAESISQVKEFENIFSTAQKDFERSFKKAFFIEAKKDYYLHMLLSENSNFFKNVFEGLIEDFFGRDDIISDIDALKEELIDYFEKDAEFPGIQKPINVALSNPAVIRNFKIVQELAKRYQS